MTGILNTDEQPVQNEQPEQESMSGQDAFDQFAINAMKILHDGKVADKLIQRVKGQEDTIATIGDAAFDITLRLQASAEESGKNLELNTIINGLNVVVGEIINICEAAGANPLSEEQKYQAFSWALSKYLDTAVKTGKITKEELVQMTEEIEQSGQEIPGGVSPSEQQGPMPDQPMQGQPMPPQAQGGM